MAKYQVTLGSQCINNEGDHQYFEFPFYFEDEDDYTSEYDSSFENMASEFQDRLDNSGFGEWWIEDVIETV